MKSSSGFKMHLCDVSQSIGGKSSASHIEDFKNSTFKNCVHHASFRGLLL